MSEKELLKCYHSSCGKEYKETENKDNSCNYHPGTPVFHDALKGWSCCKRRVTDFTEFLNIQGCTQSKHSNIKPPEQAKVKTVEEVTKFTGQNTHRKPDIKEVELRPRDDLPYQKLKAIVSESLKKALEKDKSNVKKDNEDDNEKDVVKKGTNCKNNSCSSTYQDDSSKKEKCHHHPGTPVFHEGYKFWSCCLKRTSDFDEFLKQAGCTTGSHVWFLTDEQKKKAVACRYDHYQMGSFLVVSVYAKLCDPEKSYVETNQTCMRSVLIFGNASRFEMDIKLHGVIEPEKSTVTYSATKVEIKLQKKSPSSWPSLELKLASQ